MKPYCTQMKEDLKTTSIMLTVEQWERLRNEAHKSRRSQSEIIREALEMRWVRKKEEKKMKTYWIDECIVTPEGKLLPKGFELHIGETARIVVPSDVPGDRESLYEEEIQLSQETFAATYEDENPVHVDDGETIGFEREISIVENDQGERWEVRMTHNYMDARQIDENGNPMEDWKEISWSIFCENHRIDTDSF